MRSTTAYTVDPADCNAQLLYTVCHNTAVLQWIRVAPCTTACAACPRAPHQQSCSHHNLRHTLLSGFSQLKHPVAQPFWQMRIQGAPRSAPSSVQIQMTCLMLPCCDCAPQYYCKLPGSLQINTQAGCRMNPDAHFGSTAAQHLWQVLKQLFLPRMNASQLPSCFCVSPSGANLSTLQLSLTKQLRLHYGSHFPGLLQPLG